jgi:hypothetical protein
VLLRDATGQPASFYVWQPILTSQWLALIDSETNLSAAAAARGLFAASAEEFIIVGPRDAHSAQKLLRSGHAAVARGLVTYGNDTLERWPAYRRVSER